jgi:tRNA modification GTPase
MATLCRIFEGPNDLDDAIVTLFAAPNSFTGEDVVEISTHGGAAVSASVIAALISSGAVAALPGEFTRRAVLNGKLDLIQAEAIGDLVDARSSAMQKTALAQLHGGLSRLLGDLRDKLLTVEALIAYDIDFPDEDDGPVKATDVDRAVDDLDASLSGLLSTISFGRLIRDGATVVIAGPPNAGKSSLFNAMLGVSRAIVTEIPGTTRDALEAVIDTDRWPLRLVDTAGLRQSADRIEKLGIEISERYLAGADVVLACDDSIATLEETCAAVSELTESPVIQVWTKSDLRSGENGPGHSGEKAVSVSAETRTGLDSLFARISSALSESYGIAPRDNPVLTTARQQSGIAKAREELRQFREALRSEEAPPVTVAAVHLRAATAALDDLIGGVDVEDVLTKLFSTFCVGK